MSYCSRASHVDSHLQLVFYFVRESATFWAPNHNLKWNRHSKKLLEYYTKNKTRSTKSVSTRKRIVLFVNNTALIVCYSEMFNHIVLFDLQQFLVTLEQIGIGHIYALILEQHVQH